MQQANMQPEFDDLSVDTTGDAVLWRQNSGLAPVDGVRVVPHGRRAQLGVLRRQLEWAEAAVRKAQAVADRAMRDPDLDEAERWQAVQRLRALSWKVCREVIPLVGRVPGGMQDHEDFRDVERATHALRRQTEDALRDNANYTVDLVAAMSGPYPRRR